MKNAKRAAAVIGLAAFPAIAFTPLTPYARTAQGDQCWTWHATTQDNSGRTLTCVHTPTTGHLMYWEYGGQTDS
jgi:hypothetical protein